MTNRCDLKEVEALAIKQFFECASRPEEWRFASISFTNRDDKLFHPNCAAHLLRDWPTHIWIGEGRWEILLSEFQMSSRQKAIVSRLASRWEIAKEQQRCQTIQKALFSVPAVTPKSNELPDPEFGPFEGDTEFSWTTAIGALIGIATLLGLFAWAVTG